MALFNKISTLSKSDNDSDVLQVAPVDKPEAVVDQSVQEVTAANEEAKLTGLQKAQAKMAAMRAAGELNIVRLDPVEKAKANPKSLRAAITAHCFTCCGGGADPGVRQSVRDCKVTACSLHHLRPWQHVLGKSADQMTEEELEDNAGQTEELLDDTDE